MLILLCLFLCLTPFSLSTSVQPLENFDSAELDELDRFLDIGAILRGLVSSVGNVIGTSLNVTANTVHFLGHLKQAIGEKIKAGGKITRALLTKLTSHTLNLAVNKEIFQIKDVDRIRATFDIPTSSEIVPLTQNDIEYLKIGGDQIEADDFKEDLKELIEAKNNGAPLVNVLAGLECHLADLLAGNSIIQQKGALDLKAYFNLPNLVRAIRNPVKAIAGVVNFVISLQGKIVGATQYVNSFLTHIRTLLVVKAQAMGQFTTTLLTEVLRTTLLNLAVGNGVIDADTSARLIATFAGEHALPFGALAFPFQTVEEIDNLDISGKSSQAVIEFKSTLRSLFQLKQIGTPKPIILGALQVAVMTNLAANGIMQVSVAVPLLNKLGLTPLAELITSATKLLSGIQHGVAGNAHMAAAFVTNVKGFVHEKLATGGQLTINILTNALRATLNLASKDGVIQDHTGFRLAASFGVNLTQDAIPLGLAEIDELMIGGNTSVASEFRCTVKALLNIGWNGDMESMVSTLAGLNVAIVDLLASNNIIMATAAVGLKEFFVTENSYSLNNWKNDESSIE